MGKGRDKAARFLLQKEITNRRHRVSLSWSVEVYKRKNKGIVSIKTNLSVVKLLFNELFRCLELLHDRYNRGMKGTYLVAKAKSKCSNTVKGGPDGIDCHPKRERKVLPVAE